MLRELLINAPLVVKVSLKDVLGFVEIEGHGHAIALGHQQIPPPLLLGREATIKGFHFYEQPVKATPANGQEQVWNPAPDPFPFHCCRHCWVTLATVRDGKE
jgi:hypothetical protein